MTGSAPPWPPISVTNFNPQTQANAAGATDIIVEDGHGGGFNFIPEQMHPGARYFTGRNRNPFMCWADMYAGIDAAILLGYHSMAGTADGRGRLPSPARTGPRRP